MTTDKRPHISPSIQVAVWAAAAGRCTFCNRLVTENEDLGEAVSIGELAHNVGWGDQSPRGDADLTHDERSQADNLLLLCRNCHKPADASGVVGRYSVDELRRFKRDHETRIRELTSIGADRTAALIRVVGNVRGINPELSRDTVLAATTAAHYFPQLLPWSHWGGDEVDLRGLTMDTSDDFQHAAKQIDALAERINAGIQENAITRLAVFAFARIPLLVHLGARLDDKIDTLIFQRQRLDGANAWRWIDTPPTPPAFGFRQMQPGDDTQRVALLLNLSGTIHPDALPADVRQSHTLYSLEPSYSTLIGPSLISSEAALHNYEAAVRAFLAHVERTHHGAAHIAIFAAIPVAAAVTLGRTLMPNISPALAVYDRDSQGVFFHAMEVKR